MLFRNLSTYCLFMPIIAFAENKTTDVIKPSLAPFTTNANNAHPDAPKFQPYGINYAIYHKSFNNSSSLDDDEAAIEGHYSLRYAFYDCRRGKETEWNSCDNDSTKKLTVFFSFTGEFDFYVGTRHSGPVINRTSNPALHFYTLLSDKERLLGIDFLDVALEHRSNGQATEIYEKNEEGRLKTQAAYFNGDHEYFDSISRGANYLSFAVGTDSLKNKFNWKASFKAYITNSTAINWGKLASKDVDIKDYDLVRIAASYKHDGKNFLSGVTYGAEYTFGKEFFDTDSLELMLMKDFLIGNFTLPLMLKVHLGPMKTLSNYTQSVTSVGFGLVLNF